MSATVVAQFAGAADVVVFIKAIFLVFFNYVEVETTV